MKVYQGFTIDIENVYKLKSIENKSELIDQLLTSYFGSKADKSVEIDNELEKVMEERVALQQKELSLLKQRKEFDLKKEKENTKDKLIDEMIEVLLPPYQAGRLRDNTIHVWIDEFRKKGFKTSYEEINEILRRQSK